MASPRFLANIFCVFYARAIHIILLFSLTVSKKRGGHEPSIIPLYKDVLAPITGAELRTALHKMGRNKAPGPSGITVEMLRHLPDMILDNWLLPLVNYCLTH